MIEVNLIPDVKKELIQAQKVRTLVISVAIIATIAAVAVTILLGLYVFGAQSLLLGNAKNSITRESDKLKNVQDLPKILTLQNQVMKISESHNSKSITSRVFQVLRATNPPSPNNIAISTVNIDTAAGQIKIEAQSQGGYRALETYNKTIAAAKFAYTPSEGGEEVTVPLATDVVFDGVGYGRDTTGRKVLSFSLTFTYAPELFAVTSEQGKVGDLKYTNVTDSFVAIPESLFTSKAKPIEEEGQ